jgi:O-antigen/teichoic acid export membrane protein
VLALASVPLAGPVLEVLVGPAYADAAAVVPWFVVLGTLLALVQLSTYAAVAADRSRFFVMLWAVVASQVTLTVLVADGGIEQIVGVWIAGTALLAVLGMTTARRARA